MGLQLRVKAVVYVRPRIFLAVQKELGISSDGQEYCIKYCCLMQHSFYGVFAKITHS